MYPLLLVVDDDADTRDWVKLLLELDGYDVLTAADGFEALHMIKSCNPDLIISDVMMPGMDGVTLCNTLKRDVATASIPVILCSAYPGKIPSRLIAQMTAVLAKPVDIEQLEREIKAALA